MDTVGKYPVQLLLDILTDGYESWSGLFWAQAEPYKWTWWYTNIESDGYPAFPYEVSPDLTPDTVLLRLHDVSDEAEENAPLVDITLAKMAEATDWARENYSHLLAPWTVGKDGIIEEINYDAIGADVIIQKIVLGDAIYG